MGTFTQSCLLLLKCLSSAKRTGLVVFCSYNVPDTDMGPAGSGAATGSSGGALDALGEGGAMDSDTVRSFVERTLIDRLLKPR